MKIKTRFWLLSLLLGVVAMTVAGCLARSAERDAAGLGYLNALERLSGSTEALDDGVSAFSRAYADLTDPNLGELMTALYAEDIFFNDTVHTFTDRQNLVDYLTRTGAGLHESQVEIHQVLIDQADVFVRWTMEFKTRAVGRDIHSQSIGMTHLRFDQDGRVILHQDYWDSAGGLFDHLPVVGFAIDRARSRME